MKVRIRGLRLDLDYTPGELQARAAGRLGIHSGQIQALTLVKRAVDARRSMVCFTCTVEVELDPNVRIAGAMLEEPDLTVIEDKNVPVLEQGSGRLNHAPLVIGSGPAGLFCALALARRGYQPVIIEQGQDVEQRVQGVQKFWQSGILDGRSNVQFGEGGAGTFSDGKLTTRSGDFRVDYVLKTFVEYGADPEILYIKKPHVGTDKIRRVVKRIRQEIIRLGGEVYFQARLTDINIKNGLLESISVNGEEEIPCSVLVLATGNSARELYRLLEQRGVRLIPKALAVGLRVEHPQAVIDKMQYGDFAGHPRLGAADYHFTYQDKLTGRSLYTFCMCPGGYVIGAASAAGQLVTNGMSFFERDSGVANSALVVTVTPDDWNHETLGGIRWQEELEKRAFVMGGENYRAPAQYLQDFLAQRPTASLQDTLATYTPGVNPANLWDLLPRELAEVMSRGLKMWGRRAPAFLDEQAVLSGVETRTSAPLRIERDASLCSVGIPGLYPCGEGAGYAGGIVSAAVDGLKVAEQIISSYRGPMAQAALQSTEVVKGSTLAD